ncbi:hypothetical protein [Sneathiella sp. HT1-7]|uniref:hypothetical protein n=1 Tax=Sneathiella sp. HT1-7 TaxID=2887192 RepID=UPI001D146380|nr:hypothetical protein [Sneathiella sp. HT1-7]MCC3303581.1 hypothetical protein [Sneathiella sp. HT1-7]
MSIETSAQAAYRARARNTNVNDVTLLATDYLNHFNEALMLAELVIDMPDMLDDLIDWLPVTYEDHFRFSGIADKELAIEAYAFSPTEYKAPFAAITMRLDEEIQEMQTNLSLVDNMEDVATRGMAERQCAVIRELIEQAGAIINGHICNVNTQGPSEDGMEDEGTLDQDEINAMFG